MNIAVHPISWPAFPGCDCKGYDACLSTLVAEQREEAEGYVCVITAGILSLHCTFQSNIL